MFIKSWQEVFGSGPKEILKRREEGIIYTADFKKGIGRYISSVISGSDPVDLQIQISPKVELRIAYIFEKEEISGIQITKLSNQDTLEKIHLSTLDWEGILNLLWIFSEVDLKSLSSKNLILNEKIIENPDEINKFLKTLSLDPLGKEKMIEIVKNFGALESGDIDQLSEKKKAVSLFKAFLNNEKEFESKKAEWKIQKDEEVWQRFFKDNSWILGTEFIEILDERVVDTENITDYLVKSYDGFVDIVELKLPTAEFWNTDLTMKSDLSRSLMQCMRYLSSLEEKVDSVATSKKLQGTAIVKPRITLIYGSSKNWTEDQKKTYRILNSNLQSISILTYDHVFERSSRITSFVPLNSEEQYEEKKIIEKEIQF